jgi:endonuclease G
MPGWRAGASEEAFRALAEARAEAYSDRAGFDPDFSGRGLRVELPVKVDGADVLTYEDLDGTTRSELRYTHFSVAMSASRRLCLWSAVNIDGLTSVGAERPSWRIEERTGLSFGALTDHDALHADEALARPLTSLDQIRLTG